MKKYKIKIILITFIMSFCFACVHFSAPTSVYKKKIPQIDLKEQYQVVKVLDGDTFQIKINKEIVTVRMLGIDTPETVDPRKGIQCYGKQASDKTKELLLGKYVSLSIDSSQNTTDKFGRILAYVNVKDGIPINQYLLEYGYAREYKYKFDYQERKEFKKLENLAKKKKIGLWGTACQGE